MLENLKNVQAAAKQLQCATASLAGSLMGLNEVVATSVTHTTTATSTPTATSPTSAVKYLTGAAEEMSKGPWGLRLQPHEEIPTLTAALTDMVTEKVSLRYSLTHSLTHTCTHLLTHALTYTCTHLLTHALTYTYTHSFPHSLTHSSPATTQSFVASHVST